MALLCGPLRRQQTVCKGLQKGREITGQGLVTGLVLSWTKTKRTGWGGAVENSRQ